jgi:antirestriction protein ArdC
LTKHVDVTRTATIGTFTPKEREDDEDRSIPYLKGYTVFNVEQIENLPDRFASPAEELPSVPVPHMETVEVSSETPTQGQLSTERR